MSRPPSQPFASDLSGECLQLFEQVHDRHARHHLRGFMGYICHIHLQTFAANNGHLSAYLKELEGRKVKRITQIGRDVATNWNKMGDACPHWPSNRLTVADSPRPRSLPFEAFPRSFETDVRAYLHWEPSKVELFDERSRQSFAQATRADRARKIRLIATIAVDCGVPATSFRSLADLIEVSTAKTVLEHVWHQHDQKPNGHAANLARALISIANHLQADRRWIEQLKAAHRKMRPDKSGMADSNRRKLRALTDEANLRRLVQLPQAIVASLNNEKPTIRDALLLQSALGVAILFSAPMREKNLVGLHDGQLDRGSFIVIPRNEVKNDRTLHYDLPARVRNILTIYRELYRPLLAKGKMLGGSSWHATENRSSRRNLERS
jgi:hypothetical protein